MVQFEFEAPLPSRMASSPLADERGDGELGPDTQVSENPPPRLPSQRVEELVEGWPGSRRLWWGIVGQFGL